MEAARNANSLTSNPQSISIRSLLYQRFSFSPARRLHAGNVPADRSYSPRECFDQSIAGAPYAAR